MADARGAARAAGAAKALGCASFLWAGLDWGASHSAPGRIALGGLGLCALGDVLLIPPGTGLAFRLGIAAFALGHIAYAAACLALGVAPTALGLGALAALPLVALAWRSLGPHLAGSLRGAVAAYLAIVSAMAVLALAASGTARHSRSRPAA